MNSGSASLAGRVAVVTGASAGIGAAYADALAATGARVVALARSFEPAGDRSGAADPGTIARRRCDVSDEQQVASTLEGIVEDHGCIDVLVNNAGAYPHHGTLAMTTREWEEVMAVNVRGVYLMMRYVAPHMIAAGRGSIVNISSNSALHSERGGTGHEGLCAYGVSKAAADRLTDFMAEELAPHGIAVNGLRPGGVLTDTWRRRDPAAYAASAASGRGKRCLPEVVGPPMLHLAVQTPMTMTGRIVAARDFGTAW